MIPTSSKVLVQYQLLNIKINRCIHWFDGRIVQNLLNFPITQFIHRGANREILSEVEHIISFCIVLAYHLRLEVAYYNDRFAQLPASNDEDW